MYGRRRNNLFTLAFGAGGHYVVIGRGAECDVTGRDHAVSRRHVRPLVRAKKVVVEDPRDEPLIARLADLLPDRRPGVQQLTLEARRTEQIPHRSLGLFECNLRDKLFILTGPDRKSELRNR